MKIVDNKMQNEDFSQLFTDQNAKCRQRFEGDGRRKTKNKIKEKKRKIEDPGTR